MPTRRILKSAEQIKTLEHTQLIAADGHTIYTQPKYGPCKTKHSDAHVNVTGNKKIII